MGERAKNCLHCGRVRATAADLDRWHREFGPGETASDPPWAAVLCWTVDWRACNYRPVQEESDAG